jgi:biotin synthase
MERFWERVRAQAMSGEGIGREDALSVLSLGNDALWRLLDVAESVRRRFKGDGIRLCSIVNAKSGLCSEDCSFCAQSRRSGAGIEKYPLLSGEEIFREAAAAKERILDRRLRPRDAEPGGADPRRGCGGPDPDGVGAGNVR